MRWFAAAASVENSHSSLWPSLPTITKVAHSVDVHYELSVTTTKLHTSGSGASIHYIIANTLTSALATRGSCFWIDWHLDSTPFFVSEQAPAQGVGIVVVLIGATRS